MFNEKLFCPVCNTHLGDRKKKEFIMLHCDECSVTFTFRNDPKKPEAALDKHKTQKCGCKNCGR